MNLQEFITKWNGKKADFDGVYGGQCVDLYDFYCRDVVGAPIHYVNGAKDIWENYPKTYFNRIPNTPTGVPIPSSVMIWGNTYGPYGHVAIVTEANVDRFKALSQNDPVGTLTQIREYSYDHVLGWLEPVQNVNSSTTTMDRRPYWFDLMNKVIWNKPFEQITDQMVNDWIKDYPTQRNRSGLWDKLAIKAGYTGNTNILSVDDLYGLILGSGGEAFAAKIKELETKLAEEKALRQSQKQTLIAKIIEFIKTL